MKYQYSTYYPLAESKTYLEDKLEAVDILMQCVDMTNEYRKKRGLSKLTLSEIENGQRMLKIDNDLNPKWQSILGNEKAPTIENLKRQTYIKEED